MPNRFELPAFWITNISDRNVSLADLNLTVKAFTSINLLDNKHYYYTKEQLQLSAISGSLFKKSSMIVVRKVAPTAFKMNMPYTKETFIPSRERSIYSIKEENYEELNFSEEDQKMSDEAFAKENADTAELDLLPLIKKATNVS